MNAPLTRCQLLLAIIFTGLSSMAQAQDAPDSAAEPLRYYQVEVLVFRHLDQSRTTGEIPRMPETEMADLLEQDLARLADEPVPATGQPDPLNTPQDPAPDAGTKPDFVAADNDRLLLENTARRIDDLSVYELVSYLSWGQTAPEVTAGQAFDVKDLGAGTELLSGSIELYQRRFLHLALDLTLADSDTAEISYGDAQELPRGSAALPVIKDSRRIRLETFQYFDQPSFGVIAVVSRLEVPEQAAAAQSAPLKP